MSVPTRITFKHVATLFRSIIEKDNNKVLLGRWGLTENKNTNLVIDYSNEDHCGTCSQYALQKQKIDKNRGVTMNYLNMNLNIYLQIRNKKINYNQILPFVLLIL